LLTFTVTAVAVPIPTLGCVAAEVGASVAVVASVAVIASVGAEVTSGVAVSPVTGITAVGTPPLFSLFSFSLGLGAQAANTNTNVSKSVTRNLDFILSVSFTFRSTFKVWFWLLHLF
jgi:hypothetical protein